MKGRHSFNKNSVGNSFEVFMRKTCSICGRSKGKRLCRVQQYTVVCPRCCASIRNIDCEGCSYYISSLQYKAIKQSSSEAVDFLVELDDEIEKSTDEALLFIEQSRFQQGEAILQQLFEKYPYNHAVRYGMGILHALLGDHDQAIVHFDKAIEIHPNFIEAHFNKAVAYKEKMDIRNMVQAFRKVVEIGDKHDEIVQQAKDFLADIEQHLHEHEGLTIDTYFQGMDVFELGVVAMHEHDWVSAIRYFETCSTINKNHPQSYGNIGVCYATLGQKAMALAAFDKAIEIDPKYEPAIVNKAVIKSLQDGEKLPSDNVKTMDYFQEYPRQNKSYIESFIRDLKHP